MLNKRKQLYHYKIEKLLKEYNNILFYQHSGLDAKKWRKLREELLQITDSSVADQSGITTLKGSEPGNNATVIFIKDRIAHRLETSPTSCDIEKSTIYRGPLLLIGCISHRDMVLAHDTISKQAQGYKYTVLLLGGLYYKTQLNPKDLSRLLRLDNSVYTSFLDVAENPLPNLTQQLTILQHNLLYLIRNIG